jgi:hypothetical protein
VCDAFHLRKPNLVNYVHDYESISGGCGYRLYWITNCNCNASIRLCRINIFTLGSKAQSCNCQKCNFYICTVHPDTIKVYYSPTNAQVIVLKTILKYTLKQLRHVSVQQSHHLQEARYSCLLKLQFVKVVTYGSSVYD